MAQKDDSLSMVGGNVSLVIDTAVPGSDPLSAIDNRTRLRWGKPSNDAIILISTSCPGQKFSLTATAINVGSGTATGAVELFDGMPPTQFIVALPAGVRGGAEVEYTAAPALVQGMGTDVHTVTFTMIQP